MTSDIAASKSLFDPALPLRPPLRQRTQNKAALHYLTMPDNRVKNACAVQALDALPAPLFCGGEAMKNTLISVPHGGRCYPQGWFNGAYEVRARSLEDAGTDSLGLLLASASRPALIAQIGRAVCDLNRPENAMDKQICPEGIYTPDAVYKPYIMAGYGVIPRLSADREALYPDPFTPEQASDILHRFHRPYHQILAQKLETILTNNAHGLLVDLHSMPDAARHFNQKRGPTQRRALPDIIFGNLHGATLPAYLVKIIDEVMGAHNFSWGWNTPYAGGYTTRHYGLNFAKQTEPSDRHLSVLQIEVNRTLFLDRNNAIDATALLPIAQLLDILLSQLEASL